MTLTEFLKQKNYTQIALTKSGVGHFHIGGSLAERSVSVLIDTGAANTVFSFDLAEGLNLPMNKLEMSGGGVGAARMSIYQIERARFLVGDVEPKISVLLAMDFTHVNQALAAKGEPPVEAILGADALEAHSAIIDYESRSLFLKV